MPNCSAPVCVNPKLFLSDWMFLRVDDGEAMRSCPEQRVLVGVGRKILV